MLPDPGTINSDVELSSESDNEPEYDQIQTSDDFFSDLPAFVQNPFSSEDESDETSKKSAHMKSKDVSKYVNEGPVTYDVTKLVDKVRIEELKKKDSVLNEMEEEMDNPDTLKSSQNDHLKCSSIVANYKKKQTLNKLKEREKNEKRMVLEMKFEEAPSYTPGITFIELNLSSPILKAITQMKYHSPTPVQAVAIPFGLKGRDICGCSATGTGKTAAFMIPILQRLLLRSDKRSSIRAVILVPTRELAIQVFEMSKQLGQFVNIKMSLVVGGLNRKVQLEELSKRPDIIIATPGRLIDHLETAENFCLSSVEILVLDEADRMLDELFIEQLQDVMRQCRITKQTMLFSATMTREVKVLAQASLKNPVRVFINKNTTLAENLVQEFVRMKAELPGIRLAILAHLLTKYFRESCLVFVQKKTDCHYLRVMFNLLGLATGEFHGDQTQKERIDSLNDFRNHETAILFATDIASRGLDIVGIRTVINYQTPLSYQIYLHRVGRTARAGYCGRAITISEDQGFDFGILRKIKKNSNQAVLERKIKLGVLKSWIEKIKKLKPTVEKVLALEVEEKAKMVAEALEKVSDELKNPGLPKVEKQKKWKVLRNLKEEKSKQELQQKRKLEAEDDDQPKKKEKKKKRNTKMDNVRKNKPNFVSNLTQIKQRKPQDSKPIDSSTAS